MNIHQVWIIVKILAMLLFFSGIFVMIRFFKLGVEYRIKRKLRDEWISFWDPWWVWRKTITSRKEAGDDTYSP